MKIKIATFLILVAALPAIAQKNWKVERTIHIGGTGGWDYLTVDPESHHLYVTRSTHTMIIDPDSGKVLADITGQKRSHGVALAPKQGRGFISDGGGDGAIVIFDLKTNEILGTAAAQPDADGIIFDPSSGLVLAVCGDSGTLLTLKADADPKTAKIDTPIDLGGKPEFLAADGKGKVYIDLVDKNEVVVVDLTARKVVSRWPSAPGGTPVGMAMDTKNRRLFVGCRKPQKLVVMSADDGKVVTDLPIGMGVDATKFDQGQAFASTGDGALAVAAETSAGKFEIVETVQTPRGARTMGVDSSTHKIYLPTAEFEPQSPGETGRPKPKPDSFMIVVVSQ
jgi:DNA-binding beta-propeller fold protein YncE